jgi:O-antigen/teichoic acid export membrane protein
MNPDAPNGESPQRGDTISRNAMFGLATQMSTALFTAVLTLYLVRALSPAEYGTLALAIGITGLLLKPSDIGTTQATARYVAERHGDAAGVRGVLGMALPMKLLTASSIALVLFALAGPISNLYNAPELAWPLRGAAIALFGQAVMRFTQSVFVALRRTSSAFSVVLSESAMEFTATVGLVVLGGGVTGAAFGRAVGYVFGAVLGIVLLARLLGHSPIFGAGPSPVRRPEFMRYAGAMLIVQGAGAVFAQIDVLLLGAFLTTSSVAFFSAPLRLTAFLAYPGMALSQGVAPRLARHRDDAPRLGALRLGLRYLVIFQVGVVAVLIVWADPIVHLALGSKFSASADVLRALAPLVFLSGINPIVVSPLNFAGEGRRRIPITIAAVIVNAALDVILIPAIGILGAAVGSDVAYTLYAGSNLWVSHRVLGLPLRPVAVTAARSLVAGGALAAVLAVAGTGSSLSPLEWLGGAVVGGIAYVAVLLLTREVSAAELRSLSVWPLRTLRGR